MGELFEAVLKVSILVVMDIGLRQHLVLLRNAMQYVSILVVMDIGLRPIGLQSGYFATGVSQSLL